MAAMYDAQVMEWIEDEFGAQVPKLKESIPKSTLSTAKELADEMRLNGIEVVVIYELKIVY
jgi:hypothetical protein